MLTTENTYFLKIILLLYDAASFILRHIVVRELEKHGGDLDNLLTKDEFKNKLKHKLHFGKSQVDKLFPSNGKSDIQTWDSQMLAVVSLLIFRSTLSGDEKYHIKFIKLTRNNVAHKPSASYLEDDFVDEKDGIVKAITILASNFDTTVQESCRKLISSYCSDPFDVQLAIKHLKEDTTNRELFRQILDAVNEKHEIVRKDIQDHAEKMENKFNLTEKKIFESRETVLNSLNGLCLDIGNVESKVTESKEKSSQELKQVNASLTNHIVKETEKVSQKVDSNNSFLLQELQRSQNEHAVKLESKLEEIKQLFEQTSRNSGHCTKQIKFQEPGQNPETERAVEEFLNFIKGFKGVELKAVERKCILLAFECWTYESLRELTEFINSNEFHKYLDSIARALETDLKIAQKLVISSEIPVDSLQLVVDDTSSSIKPESKKGIALSFECTSIDGLDAFWRLFVKGEATPYIDKIAATVSSEAREKTSLSTSVNMQELEDVLTCLEATVTKQNETGLFKLNETTQKSSDLELERDTKDIKSQEYCVQVSYHAKDNKILLPYIQYQDEFSKPDPLYPVNLSVQDTLQSADFPVLPERYLQIIRQRRYKQDTAEHSMISGNTFPRFPMKDLADRFSISGESRLKEQTCLHEIESAGTQHGGEQHLKQYKEESKISPLHYINRFSLVYQKTFYVRFGKISYTTIYACAILSDERLMLAVDKGLSVVSINTGRVEREKKPITWPSDIAVLPNYQVAVTLPLDDKILILRTTDMSLISSIPDVDCPCGITYYKDELYVVCHPHGGRPCVNIYNLQGGLLREIKCDEISLYSCPKIAVSIDAQNLYITDYGWLNRYSTHGKMIARYRFSGSHLKALTLLDDGSLLVVSAISGMIHSNYTIHHISADLQQEYELKLDERSVRFICVDPVKNRIYVIDYDHRLHNQTIKVYCLQKHSSQSDKKLTSGTADEKLTSLEAKKRSEPDEKLHSFKTDKKLTSFKSEKKSTSFKAEKEANPLQSEKRGTNLKQNSCQLM